MASSLLGLKVKSVGLKSGDNNAARAPKDATISSLVYTQRGNFGSKGLGVPGLRVSSTG
jgi:hypothetical protein